MTNSDYDFLVAISRTLSDDDTLFSLVDGKFQIDFPATKVAANITSGNQTMISISLPNVMTRAMMGYDHSGRVLASGMLQIDVASIKGNNMSYCRQVTNKIKTLIEGDVVKTTDQQYVVYVDRINDNSFFDEEIGAWHSSMIVYIEYIKSSK